VIAFSVGAGVTSAFSAPAMQALIAQLVPEHDVPQAVALNSMTFNLARAIGPTSAAAVIVAPAKTSATRRSRWRRLRTALA